VGTLLNRLLRPWVVYTELTLSVLLVFTGLGQKVWGGGGPHSSAAGTAASGNFIMLLGAICVVFSLLLLALTVTATGSVTGRGWSCGSVASCARRRAGPQTGMASTARAPNADQPRQGLRLG